MGVTIPRHVPKVDLAPWERPAPSDRAARSEAIEARIHRAAARIGDENLRRLFENTLPNTLDTTLILGGSDERPDTFVLTGDIHAMWLRDSTAQIWPYLSSVTADPHLDRIIRGMIHRQSEQVLLDPYANAFLASETDDTEWTSDETDMRPGVHERKWEPDSHAAFCRLASGYWQATHSARPFDAGWCAALDLVLTTLRTEQRRDGTTPYRFNRPQGDPTDFVPNGGRGAPTRPNGMVHGAFRPSDDACLLPLNVPVNLALAAALEQVAPVASAVNATDCATRALALAAEIRAGVARDGGADVWAYEVDGLGGSVRMDDANAPSLLALPYLGACRADDPRYLATRRWVLSADNPWRFSGAAATGIGSPHTGPRRIWPIALAMQGLTASTASERLACVRMLGATHAGSYLAHESFDADDPKVFTRPWFAWANSLVGELLERAALEGLLE